MKIELDSSSYRSVSIEDFFILTLHSRFYLSFPPTHTGISIPSLSLLLFDTTQLSQTRICLQLSRGSFAAEASGLRH